MGGCWALRAACCGEGLSIGARVLRGQRASRFVPVVLERQRYVSRGGGRDASLHAGVGAAGKACAAFYNALIREGLALYTHAHPHTTVLARSPPSTGARCCKNGPHLEPPMYLTSTIHNTQPHPALLSLRAQPSARPHHATPLCCLSALCALSV